MLRKIFMTNCLLLMISLAVVLALFGQGGRSYTLFVFPFETENLNNNRIANNFRKELIKAVEESGRFDLVEEATFRDSVKEMNKQKKMKIKTDEAMTQDVIMEVAKAMNVKVAITGTLSSRGTGLYAKPEFVEVGTGEKLVGEEVSVDSEKDIDGLVGKVTDFFFNQIDIDRYVTFGRDYYNSRLYDKALENFEKALDLAPERADIVFWIGNSYAKLNDQTKAIESYNMAAEIDPEFVNAFYQLGLTYYEMKDWENAVRNFKKASTLKPEDITTYNYWGNALFESAKGPGGIIDSAKVDEAVRIYQMGISTAAGETAGLHNAAAIALYSSGRFDEAIPFFRNYLESKPDDATMWVYLAASYQKKGDYQGTVDAYEKAVAAQPCYPSANKNLGIFYATKFKKYGTAVDRFTKALECELGNEEKGEIYLARGDALNQLKRFSDALSSLDMAEQTVPRSSVSYYRVFAIKGEALKDWGDQRQAEDTLPGYESSISLYNRAIAAFRLAINDPKFKKFANQNIDYCEKQIKRSDLLVKQKQLERRERSGQG